MRSMRAAMRRGALSVWLLMFLVWAAANATTDPVVLVLGLLLTGGIALAVTGGTAIWADIRLSPARMLALAHFLLTFLRELVKSNLAVLRLVYAPRLSLQPGVVPVTMRLKSPLARFVLSEAVTLTPGSLVLAMEGPILTLHVIDLNSTDIQTNTGLYVGAFNPDLERAFD